MSDDECTCGRCELDTCDLCGAPVALVDDYNEAWCAACWQRQQDSDNERAWLRLYGSDQSRTVVG